MVGGGRARPAQFVRRVHNRPALRRRCDLVVFGQLILVVSGLGLGGAIGYLSHDYLTRHRAFNLQRVLVDSVPIDLREPILERMASAENANLLTIDLEPLQRSIEEIPQVERAHLRRQLPDAVEIRVELREPWAIIHAQDGHFLVSADGIVLTGDYGPHDALLDLRLDAELGPALDASRRLPRTLPVAVAFEDVVRIARWLEDRRPEAFGPIKYYRLCAEGVIAVPRNTPWELLIGNAEHLDDKTANLEALLAHSPPEPGTRVDLRYRDMVVLQGDLRAAAAAAQE